MEALMDNPAFRTYAVCSAILAIKMLLTGNYTTLQRMRNKGFVNEEDAKAFGGTPSQQEHQALQLDDARLGKVRATLVEGMHESGAKAALLDLTGVPRLQPGAAEALLGAAKAVRLLGAHVVLTGMQPAVASNLADLAIHLEGVETARSLGSGVEAALKSLEADRRSPRLSDQEQDA